MSRYLRRLGSETLNVSAGRVKQAEVRYYAYGADRYTWDALPTTYRYTGQRGDAGIGLYYYGARYYDPVLGRFVQADTIVPEPGNPQSLNRYAYVLNNPIRYNDPSGHDVGCPGENAGECASPYAYDSAQSVGQAWWLVWNWFFEQNDAYTEWDEASSLTQDVRNDPQIDTVRQQWAKSGHALPFSYEPTIDKRDAANAYGILQNVSDAALKYLNANGDLAQATFETLIGQHHAISGSAPNPVSGVLGSFDKVTIWAVDNETVRFDVQNTMGWKSGTRIPGTDLSLLQDKERGGWFRFGGTTWQHFYWQEHRPAQY